MVKLLHKSLRRVTKISTQKPDPDCVSEKIPKESKQEGKKNSKSAEEK